MAAWWTLPGDLEYHSRLQLIAAGNAQGKAPCCQMGWEAAWRTLPPLQFIHRDNLESTVQRHVYMEVKGPPVISSLPFYLVQG